MFNSKKNHKPPPALISNMEDDEFRIEVCDVSSS